MTQRPVVVRPAVPADEAGVHELAVDLATTFTVERDAFRDVFRDVLDDPAAALLAAAADGRVVGYALAHRHPAFFASGPVAWVEEIAVHPDLRRRGVGRLLMRDIERWAAAAGARMVALATRRAADFYVALGYAPSATYFRKLL